MNIINWLENHFLPCAYKQLLGIECPVCGSQRAFIALLKGNIIESIKLYPALIPTLIIIILITFQMILRWKRGWHLIRILFFADFALIMASYILRLLFID